MHVRASRSPLHQSSPSQRRTEPLSQLGDSDGISCLPGNTPDLEGVYRTPALLSEPMINSTGTTKVLHCNPRSHSAQRMSYKSSNTPNLIGYKVYLSQSLAASVPIPVRQ